MLALCFAFVPAHLFQSAYPRHQYHNLILIITLHHHHPSSSSPSPSPSPSSSSSSSSSFATPASLQIYQASPTPNFHTASPKSRLQEDLTPPVSTRRATLGVHRSIGLSTAGRKEPLQPSHAINHLKRNVIWNKPPGNLWIFQKLNRSYVACFNLQRCINHTLQGTDTYPTFGLICSTHLFKSTHLLDSLTQTLLPGTPKSWNDLLEINDGLSNLGWDDFQIFNQPFLWRKCCCFQHWWQFLLTGLKLLLRLHRSKQIVLKSKSPCLPPRNCRVS